MLIVLGAYLAFLAYMFPAYYDLKNLDVSKMHSGAFAKACALQEVKDVIKIGTGLAGFVAFMVYIL